MADLRVYYDLMSQPSRAVYIFLKVSGIPFIENPVALRRNENLTEEFGKINPMHLVPAINDNGFLLTESPAIMKYLCDTRDVADHWYPKDLKKRALVDEYLSWYHLNTRIKTAHVLRTIVFDTQKGTYPLDKEKLRLATIELDTCLYLIETIFLKERYYMAGDEISVADIMAICDIMGPFSAGYDIFEGRPKLTAWLERVRRRLNPLFDQVHINGPVGRVFANFNPTAEMYVKAKI